MKEDILKIKKILDREKDIHRIIRGITSLWVNPWRYTINDGVAILPNDTQGVRMKDIQFNKRVKNIWFHVYNCDAEYIGMLNRKNMPQDAYFIIGHNIMDICKMVED